MGKKTSHISVSSRASETKKKILGDSIFIEVNPKVNYEEKTQRGIVSPTSKPGAAGKKREKNAYVVGNCMRPYLEKKSTEVLHEKKGDGKGSFGKKGPSGCRGCIDGKRGGIPGGKIKVEGGATRTHPQSERLLGKGDRNAVDGRGST